MCGDLLATGVICISSCPAMATSSFFCEMLSSRNTTVSWTIAMERWYTGPHSSRY